MCSVVGRGEGPKGVRAFRRRGETGTRAEAVRLWLFGLICEEDMAGREGVNVVNSILKMKLFLLAAAFQEIFVGTTTQSDGTTNGTTSGTAIMGPHP